MTVALPRMQIPEKIFKIKENRTIKTAAGGVLKWHCLAVYDQRRNNRHPYNGDDGSSEQ